MTSISELLEFDVAVIGDRWAALCATARSLLNGKRVALIPGLGAKFMDPLPFWPEGPHLRSLEILAGRLGIELGELRNQRETRIYRNKAFQPLDSDDLELWGPEAVFLTPSECRFELSFRALEEELHRRFGSENFAHRFRLFDGIPLGEIEFEEAGGFSVSLGSGDALRASEVYYASRWKEFREVTSRNSPFSRVTVVGALQLHCSHVEASFGDLGNGFVIPLSRDGASPSEPNRNVLGYYYDKGRKSVWTLLLTQEELEDNQAITRRLRRIRTALNKAFAVPEFSKNVESEQVRLEPEAVWVGNVDVPLSRAGVLCFTDALGPGRAVAQADVVSIPDSTHTLASPLLGEVPLQR